MNEISVVMQFTLPDGEKKSMRLVGIEFINTSLHE